MSKFPKAQFEDDVVADALVSTDDWDQFCAIIVGARKIGILWADVDDVLERRYEHDSIRDAVLAYWNYVSRLDDRYALPEQQASRIKVAKREYQKYLIYKQTHEITDKGSQEAGLNLDV